MSRTTFVSGTVAAGAALAALIAGAPASAAVQTADTCVGGEVCFYSGPNQTSTLLYSTPSTEWVSVRNVKSWKNAGHADSKPDVRVHYWYDGRNPDGVRQRYFSNDCLKRGKSANFWSQSAPGVNITRVQWLASC